ALVGGDVGVDPLLGPVVARAGLVEGGQRVGRVEVVQDAQRLVLVAGGDVGDGGQRAVRQRPGRAGQLAGRGADRAGVRGDVTGQRGALGYLGVEPVPLVVQPLDLLV